MTELLQPAPFAGPPRLLDATMFWGRHGGGVRRYLEVKQASAPAHDWCHTIAAPVADGAATITIPATLLPGSGGYRFPWHRARAAQVLMRTQPDLIEAGDPYRLAWAALDAAQRLGVPVTAFCHSNLELLAALYAPPGCARAARRAARRYARHLYQQFDLVLAPSEAMGAHLREWGIDRVAVQPLGVDSAVFHPRRRDHHWRRALGLPRHARLLVYSGRFAPEKHLDVLSAAVRRLGAPYWLVAVGDGPAPPQGERVALIGPRHRPEEIATVLASADAFVHAGDQETFGLSALEAMSCGLPIVVRAAEGLRELLDARAGIGVQGPRAADFAEAIAALFEADLGELALAARRRGVEQDWQHVLPALWRRCDRLIGRSGGAAVTPSRRIVTTAP